MLRGGCPWPRGTFVARAAAPRCLPARVRELLCQCERMNEVNSARLQMIVHLNALVADFNLFNSMGTF